MQKIITLLTLLFIAGSLFAEPKFDIITEVKSDETNPYFPLVIGQKWVYSVKTKNTETITNWVISAAESITDSENGLNAVVGYKVNVQPTNEVFYFINFEGFICKYEKSETGNYMIKRLLPESANTDYNWISNDTTFIITEMNDTEIRVEYISNTDLFSGYNIFKKNIGPNEMYIYEIASADKNDFLYKLTESNIDREVQTTTKTVTETVKTTEVVTVETEPVIETKTIEKTKETPKEIKNFTTVKELPVLNTNYYYIQAGSFVIKNNALRVCSDLLARGYQAIVYEDADSLYKVLIEGQTDMELNHKRVKEEINAGAFIKKRLK